MSIGGLSLSSLLELSFSAAKGSDLMWDYHAEENRNQVFKALECEDEATRLSCLRSKTMRSVLIGSTIFISDLLID